MQALRLALLLLAAATVSAVFPSTDAPGGLSPNRTPMFILFTHDDAIKQDSYEAMLEVTEGRQSSNGCPATGVMFTTTRGTDCELLVDMWSKGYEIADHTQSHKSLKDMKKRDIEKEVVGARNEIAACGIPISDVQGLRCPYLETKPEVREVLQENGFLYDSTLIEETRGNSLSENMGNRVWPWDMENGIPINCDWFRSIQECRDDESYSNVWQVPIWDLSELGGPYTMDYGADGKHGVYDILKANFDATYAGNRAPFPIFIHTPWLKASNHLGQLKDFADYALSKPDVYFVTIRQLIAWMQNPIPADKLTPDNLGCGNPGGSGPMRNQMYTLDGDASTGGAPSEAPTPAPAPGPAPDAPEGAEAAGPALWAGESDE